MSERIEVQNSHLAISSMTALDGREGNCPLVSVLVSASVESCLFPLSLHHTEMKECSLLLAPPESFLFHPFLALNRLTLSALPLATCAVATLERIPMGFF